MTEEKTRVTVYVDDQASAVIDQLTAALNRVAELQEQIKAELAAISPLLAELPERALEVRQAPVECGNGG